MNASLKDQLKEWKRQHQEVKQERKKKKRKKQPQKKREQLSERDLRYLMGTGRPTYKRHRGSFRQR
ncbi:hypothetical protein [Bacillus sp. Hm123]|uniref:hypothetical protein n=1 Tax=Bacillus sp. Hm123 TaxID=3450745 RepID=UPI003F434A00